MVLIQDVSLFYSHNGGAHFFTHLLPICYLNTKRKGRLVGGPS